LLEKTLIQKPIQEKISQEIAGPSPPSLFVGWHNYPRVLVGPLLAFEEKADARLYDDPSQWYGASYEEIINYRSSLVRGKSLQGVKEKTRLLENIQEVVMSRKTVELEARFKKRPSFEVSFSPVTQPMGPSAPLEEMRVVGNPSIPSKVEEVFEEKLVVREAVPELLGAGADFYYIQKLFSAGVLGRDKKLVPTRWSITATDDTITKYLLEDIREFPEINEILLYSDEYLYNHFEILLLPGKWEFEQFEAWAPQTVWTPGEGEAIIVEEWEPYGGRTQYAEKEGGGYYAGRFGCVEALHGMRRQARTIVFREIYEGYKLPVGVWVLRETVKKAFEKKPEVFQSLSDALNHLKLRLRNPVQEYLKRSRILGQKTLSEY
jgi:hypothetical protein